MFLNSSEGALLYVRKRTLSFIITAALSLNEKNTGKVVIRILKETISVACSKGIKPRMYRTQPNLDKFVRLL